MKQFLIGLLGGILILTACAPATAESTLLPSPSQTPTVVPATFTPSLTQIPPTETITPLPTIPTFDARTIVTVTPAAKAECSNVNPNLTNYQFKFGLYPNGSNYVDNATIDSIMEFLNSGGQIENLIKILNGIQSKFTYQDITNDKTSDLILVSGSLFQSLDIIYCHNGQYIHFPNEGDAVGELFGDEVQFDVQDLNRNNIQDVFSISKTPTGLIAKIWEWNGQGIMDLTPNDDLMEGTTITNAELRDLDNDGIFEFILKGLPARSQDYPGQPLRSRTDIYYWNGKIYSPIITFSSPQYRFQAVQDGDIQAFQGNYYEAIKLYQDAIDSDRLDWWSKERFEQNREAAINFTTPPALTPDKTEYPRLASYAYYRLMLLYFVQGYASDAGTVYKTLQQKFGNDQYGRPYFEMAMAFWESYQSTHKMYDGCAAAIEYAAEHPEILTPLGSDYHGSQSHIYVPADVCPFR